MSNAIVVLTRGYKTIQEYSNLLKRNLSIYEKLYNKDKHDVIIFHEGNITIEQQKQIQNFTPEMPIEFKIVEFNKNTGLLNNRLCPPTELSNSFSNGYKHMCYFWSIEFLKQLEKYEYIIRIDEDCILKSINPNILDIYKQKGYVFGSPFFQGEDNQNVTVGLDRFFATFLNSINVRPKAKPTRFPYTNIMIINVKFFNTSPVLAKLHEKLIESNCIFSNRWGDMPIWGYILSIFIQPSKYIEDKNISYYHESHDKIVN